jgi:Zn-dependent protease with chaperone function
VIPAFWSAPLPAFLWQVLLHSAVAGVILFAWAHRMGLPSGRAKRHLLVVLLILPLLTAGVPGRSGREFREQRAWFDSGPVLAIPLVAGARVYHVVLLVAGMMVALTAWQEVLPTLRRRREPVTAPPERLHQRVRGLPGWDRCQVVPSPAADILVATGGRPGRPRLIVSRGALAQLTDDEMTVVLRHENAHWRNHRWARAHALFLVRILQCYNPVALFVFREYCVELEIECDAAAVAGDDPKVLARALLAVYETTARGDVGARSALRRRVDVLLGEAPQDDDALPMPAIAVASAVLLLVLPWLV